MHLSTSTLKPIWVFRIVVTCFCILFITSFSNRPVQNPSGNVVPPKDISLLFNNCRIPSSLIQDKRWNSDSKLIITFYVESINNSLVTIDLVAYIVNKDVVSEAIPLSKMQKPIIIQNGFSSGNFEIKSDDRTKLITDGSDTPLAPRYFDLIPSYEKATNKLHFNVVANFDDGSATGRIGAIKDVYADPSPPAPPSVKNFFTKKQNK